MRSEDNARFVTVSPALALTFSAADAKEKLTASLPLTTSGLSGAASASVTSKVFAVTPDSTTTAAANVSTTYNTAVHNVTLSAAVTSTGGKVSGGTVTFRALKGSTVAGSAVTSAAVTSGAASVSYPLPAALAAGSYTIQANYNGAGNFAPSLDKTHTVTIGKAKPAITWTTPKAIVYGTTLSATELNASSGGVAGTYVYTPAAGTVLKAGQQALSVTFTPTAAADYTPAVATTTLTVSKATLVIAAKSLTMIYGAKVPALTYTVTGFVNGDSAAKAIMGAPKLTTAATSASAPETYPITAALVTLTASNYTFSFVNGTLTVTPLGIVATPKITSAAGSSAGTETVSITDTTTGAAIYYTLGTIAPTTKSTLYSKPFNVTKTTTVNAIAVKAGYTESKEETVTVTVP